MIVIPALTVGISAEVSGGKKETQQISKKEDKKDTKSDKSETWIDVRATKIKALKGLPVWHLLIVYHGKDNKEYVYRGGPENKLEPYGIIIGKSAPYRPGGIDYEKDSPSKRVMTGKDAESKNICFQKELERITKGEFVYDPYGTNSNSVAYTLLVNCKVPAQKPVMFAPGWETRLVTDNGDQTSKKSKETLKDVKSDQRKTDDNNKNLNKEKNNEITDLLSKGDKSRDMGKYEEAIKYYEKALKIDPKNYAALENLGYVYYTMGNSGYAKRYFEKALQSDPKSSEASDYLSRISNENQKKKKISDLEGKGNELFRDGKYKEAIKYFEQALQIDPKNSNALNNVGASYSSLGDYENAMKYYDMAIEADPEYKLPQNNKKALEQKLGKTTENKQKNNEIKELLDKAWALVNEGKYQEAKKIYEQILENNPKNFSALWSLGYVYILLGDYENAREYYDDALNIDHNDTYVLSSLGYIYEKLGNYDKALKYYNTAIAIDPNYKYAQDHKKALEQKLEKTTAPSDEQKPKVSTDEGQNAARDLTSNWEGTMTWSTVEIERPPELGPGNCEYSGKVSLVLIQNGNVLTGRIVSYTEVVESTHNEICDVQTSGLTFTVIKANMFGSGFSGTLGTFNVNGQFTTDLLRVEISGTFDITGIPVDEVHGQFTTHRVS